MKEPLIVHTPGVCGGRARVADTRITVWTLEAWRRLGTTDVEILAAFPAISTTELAAAWQYVTEHPDEIAADIRAQGEGEEFDKFCDSLDQDTLDELVHDVKSQEASAINNDGKGAQVSYLLESGFTRKTLRTQAAAKLAADEAGRSEDEVELFVDRVVDATDEGIRMFGKYTFDDKGADAVMDIDQFADELRTMSPKNAGERLEAVAKWGKTYKRVADAILGQLDDTDEDWWEKCRENCPTVEY